jgi:hypothetical protein
MKIYEKPSVDVKTFDVEDVMALSGEFSSTDKNMFQDITGDMETPYAGVAFEW